jgi:hypothetical protein
VDRALVLGIEKELSGDPARKVSVLLLPKIQLKPPLLSLQSEKAG